MHAEHAATAAPRKRIRWWQWLLMIGAAGVVLLATVVVNAVTLARDAAVLRDEIVATLGVDAKTTVQVSAGPVLLGLARGGLSFVKDLPAEARLALSAVRKASVGVYTIDRDGRGERAEAMFASAATAMAQRGWERIVAVNDGDTQVMLFAPLRSGGTSAQKVCVAVCDEDKLIVVTGTLRPEPLVEIAEKRGAVARFL
jgi:hypothetical protein